MSVYQQLLRVQEHDTAADRLRHRRATLPELAELAAVEKSLAEVESALADASARLAAVAREQRRLEDELAATEGRIADLERRLYSGVVSAPRELQAMQADVESLRRRRSALEDDVLGRMAAREPLDAEVSALEAERARLDGEGARLRGVVAEAQAGIEAELAGEEARRAEAAAGLPADLTALYERLRVRHGGVGAAPLVGARCGGCHLTLPATEVDRIRREPPEALVTCDQCGRILVRS
ncbi:MAG TPA: C4-type zinc ribbon domain-containing protein [Acidimicrobiales bacterium]|nr:C4-type zinc ribbon domain-containing protein [Acidimicrobiales bacterium]